MQPQLEHIDLPARFALAEPNQAAAYIYFPEAGLASQVAITPKNGRLEVGIYGREGVGPASVIFGVDRSPHQLFMQVGGFGHRVSAGVFATAIEQSRTLHSLFLRYMQVVQVQTSYTALSNGSEVIGERLARWLLMCQDRLGGDDLPLTHEFLGIMLGVRRSGVTYAIHNLEGVGIIRATRGHIHVLDRKRLEDFAGDSYGVPEAEYERLIGKMK